MLRALSNVCYYPVMRLAKFNRLIAAVLPKNCKKGHEINPQNVIIGNGNRVFCKACKAANPKREFVHLKSLDIKKPAPVRHLSRQEIDEIYGGEK
jgi:hypothetical protein